MYKTELPSSTARTLDHRRTSDFSSPVANRSSQVTTWTTANIVFLLWGTVTTPDTVSQLLMRAGDIESNPGPDNCKDCGRTFSHQSRPVKCSACNSQFCRIAKGGQKSTCIGLTRWQLTKALETDKALVCRLCKGESPRKVHSYNEGVTPGRCAAPDCKCKQKIKEGADFLICTACKRHFHKNKDCSGMF